MRPRVPRGRTNRRHPATLPAAGPPTTITMAKPSLSEKEKFFASVLGDADFGQDGVLFGEDPRLARNCKWVVVDPDRHVLSVWQKPLLTQDFVSAAVQLDASVFTNGPFFNYHDFKIEAGGLTLTGRNPAISYGNTSPKVIYGNTERRFSTVCRPIRICSISSSPEMWRKWRCSGKRFWWRRARRDSTY